MVASSSSALPVSIALLVGAGRRLAAAAAIISVRVEFKGDLCFGYFSICFALIASCYLCRFLFFFR